MVVIEELPGSSSVTAAGPAGSSAPPLDDPRGGVARPAARGSSPARLDPPQVPLPPAAPGDATPRHHGAPVAPPPHTGFGDVPAAPPLPALDTPWVVAPPTRHRTAPAPLVVININTAGEQQQQLARDWKFVGSSFATLALVYVATGLASLGSAFFIDVPDSNKSRIVTWVFYGVGAGLPWLVTAVLKFVRNREGIQAALPYLCFATNTISVLAFSTRLLGLVSIRSAILMPIMLGSLAGFSVFAKPMTYNVDFIRLALFACSAIGGIGTADKLLNSKFPALRSEADLVAKAAYVQVAILTLCHCYDAVYGDDHQGSVRETVRNWYIFDTIGNRRVVSAALSTVIGTIWVVYTSS